MSAIKLDEQLDFHSVIDDLGRAQMTERRDGDVLVRENRCRKHAYTLLPCAGGKRIERLCPHTTALPVIRHSDRRFGHPLTHLHEPCNAYAAAGDGVNGNQGVVGMVVYVRQIG